MHLEAMPSDLRAAQERVMALPLVPLSPKVRKQRDQAVAGLMALARKHNAMSLIDPMAGSI